MKKALSLILVAVMLVSAMAFVTSCSKDENTLVMATNAAFPPYEYKVGAGKALSDFAGIDVEIAQAIANKLGKTLVIEDTEFGSIIGGVQTGKYDFGMAGMTVTPERLESVNFSTTYATGIQVIIVKDGSSITSLDDIFEFDDNGDPVALKDTDVKVGVQQDTTGDIYSSDAIAKWGFNDLNADGSVDPDKDRVVRYKTGAEAVAALLSDKIDMVIIDNEPAKAFVEANAGIHILAGDNEYAIEDYAICVAKENEQLLADINRALEELKNEGVLDTIINKYINAGSN